MDEQNTAEAHQPKAQLIENKPKSHKKIILIAVSLATVILLSLIGYGYYTLSNENLDLKDKLDETEQLISTINNENENLKNGLKKANEELYENNSYDSIAPCNGESCLFESKYIVAGYGIVQGYYNESTEGDWGGVEVVCQNLIVQEGTTALVDSFIEMVNEGNFINFLTDEGNLALNLDLEGLSPQDQTRIRNSTPNNPVTLRVIREIPEFKSSGVSTCYSLVDIIAVE